jgi:micrococcal nuclease
MYEYRAEVLNVVDGDTVDVKVDLGFHIAFEMRVRMLGINTPEMHSQIPEERVKAQNAKARLQELVLGKTVLLQTEKDKQEKYGRYLAVMLLGATNINEILLNEGLAVKF